MGFSEVVECVVKDVDTRDAFEIYQVMEDMSKRYVLEVVSSALNLSQQNVNELTAFYLTAQRACFKKIFQMEGEKNEKSIFN